MTPTFPVRENDLASLSRGACPHYCKMSARSSMYRLSSFNSCKIGLEKSVSFVTTASNGTKKLKEVFSASMEYAERTNLNAFQRSSNENRLSATNLLLLSCEKALISPEHKSRKGIFLQSEVSPFSRLSTLQSFAFAFPISSVRLTSTAPSTDLGLGANNVVYLSLQYKHISSFFRCVKALFTLWLN